MPRNPFIPKPSSLVFDKTALLEDLQHVDNDLTAKLRVLEMENRFRERIATMRPQLPSNASNFQRFNTNPFVLLLHASNEGYTQVSQLDRDIVLAKVFSSLETAAGRMVEDIALSIYGWRQSESAMHTPESIIDGTKLSDQNIRILSLKSGPRCLNDEMSENFADSVLSHASAWADSANVSRIDFNYGVLYGTPKMSNKKDWHILRNLVEKASRDNCEILEDHRNKWSCSIRQNGVLINARILIGLDLWAYLGGPHCALEVWSALIRACIMPSTVIDIEEIYTISDMGTIASTASVPRGYNVSILQRGQLPWLFLIARHFYDKLKDDPSSVPPSLLD